MADLLGVLPPPEEKVPTLKLSEFEIELIFVDIFKFFRPQPPKFWPKMNKRRFFLVGELEPPKTMRVEPLERMASHWDSLKTKWRMKPEENRKGKA